MSNYTAEINKQVFFTGTEENNQHGLHDAAPLVGKETVYRATIGHGVGRHGVRFGIMDEIGRSLWENTPPKNRKNLPWKSGWNGALIVDIYVAPGKQARYSRHGDDFVINHDPE